MFIFIFLLFVVGAFMGYVGLDMFFTPTVEYFEKTVNTPVIKSNSEVIGFMPYWLISKAKQDYSEYITTLAYFSLSLDGDGSIKKYTKPGETEPGYHSLISGKVDRILENTRKNNITLSLVLFSADDKDITKMIENPQVSAGKLTNDVIPIMDKYGFDDINIDIEQVSDASPEARLKFTRFIAEVKNNLSRSRNLTLSIDVVASSFVKQTNLVDPEGITDLVDKVIVMAYDYHHMGSFVSGPVAPGEGGGTVSEYDTAVAVKAGLTIVPHEKFILGIPLYGYEWETIRDLPRSAIIPGTGLSISNRKAEDLLLSCMDCTVEYNSIDKESHIIYRDEKTGNYHQVFYPDKKSTNYKVDLARQNSLGGIALWALGYEGDTILEPLSLWRD